MPAEPVIGVEERPHVAETRRRHLGHLGEEQGKVGHRADHHDAPFDERGLGLVLEQCPVALERGRELRRVVAVPETAPRDVVGCGRDGRRRIDLEERQPVDDRREVCGPLRVEQLRADRDPARLSSRDLLHGSIR